MSEGQPQDTKLKDGKADAWMPLYVGDYIASTSRLTTEQHGAYLLLLMDFWRNGAPPDQDADLAQIARLDRKAWARVRPAIERFFRIEDGLWRHKRLEVEIEAARRRSMRACERARHAAARRWSRTPPQSPDAPPDASSISSGNRRGAAKRTARAVPAHCPSQSQSQSPAGGGDSSSPSGGADLPARDAQARAAARARLAGIYGEGFARAYFDPGTWHPPASFLPATLYAFDKLRHVSGLDGVELLRPEPRRDRL